jgi:hypothetical protein
MHLLRDLFRRTHAVEHDDPLRESLRELAVSHVDATVEGLVLALQPVVLPADPDRDLGRIEQQEEGLVRHEPVDSDQVEVEHAVEPEPAPDPLVCDRRVDVAVADDCLASLERGPNDLLDVLRTGGRVEKRLRPGLDVAAVQDELADLLAELGAAGLARRENSLSVSLQPHSQELRLRRLARAVEAFEGDEHRPHPRYRKPGIRSRGFRAR